jgi:NTP pyrophosphatase (non-canonical NTP hydrolase)
MDLQALQATLRAFAAERNWQQFHTPKNLAMALMIEAAELAEIFQWMTPEQSVDARTDEVLQSRIGEELADVLIYLLQLADHTSVDLELAVADKLVKNATKYPRIGEGLTSGPVAIKSGQAHVLIDWENVQPKEADIRTLVPDVSDVWIFHGPNQKRVGADQTSFGDNVTLVPISRTGKNSLDFHLSFYMGYITSRYPAARFVVISNDQGYGPMLEHAAELGFAASQVGFGVRKTPVKKVAPKKGTATKPATVNKVSQPAAKKPLPKAIKPKSPPALKNAPKVPAAKASAQGIKAPADGKAVKTKAPTEKSAKPKAPAAKATTAKQSPVRISKDADKAYSHVVASLRKSKNKPTRKARLHGAVKSLLSGGETDSANVERVVNRMIADGYLAIDDKGAVVMKL